MSKLPRITAKEVIRVLKKKGFYKHYQIGSHATFKNEAGTIRVVVAIHAGKIIPPKTLKSLIKDSGLTIEEFKKFL